MKVYERSRHTAGSCTVCMLRGESEDILLITGENPGFTGRDTGDGFAAPLNHENAQLLRKLFPFTAPKPLLSEIRTFGLGDRLGIAAPGQLRAIEKYDAIPALAQQSIRELNLTGRTFDDVLDAATFGVFREDFRRGFIADGDHLKTDDEVEYALGSGYTMITLDCSEHIRNNVNNMTDAEVYGKYQDDKQLEELYCNKSFAVEDYIVSFSAEEFRRACLIYCNAIDHAEHIYRKYIEGRPVAFELSIDETATPTTPAQH